MRFRKNRNRESADERELRQQADALIRANSTPLLQRRAFLRREQIRNDRVNGPLVRSPIPADDPDAAWQQPKTEDALAALEAANGDMRRAALALGVSQRFVAAQVAIWTAQGQAQAAGSADAWSMVELAAIERIAELLPQERRLKNVVAAARAATQSHLDHRDGRPGRGAQTNVTVDARQQTTVHVDAVIAAVLQQRAAREQQSDPEADCTS